jgi:hypothetical protein
MKRRCHSVMPTFENSPQISMYYYHKYSNQHKCPSKSGIYIVSYINIWYLIGTGLFQNTKLLLITEPLCTAVHIHNFRPISMRINVKIMQNGRFVCIFHISFWNMSSLHASWRFTTHLFYQIFFKGWIKHWQNVRIRIFCTSLFGKE